MANLNMATCSLSEALTTSRGLPLNFADAALLHHFRQAITDHMAAEKRGSKELLQVGRLREQKL